MREFRRHWIVSGITCLSLAVMSVDDVYGQMNSLFGRSGQQGQLGSSLQSGTSSGLFGQTNRNGGSSLQNSQGSLFGNRNSQNNSNFVGRGNNSARGSNNNRFNQQGSNQRRRFNSSRTGRRGNNNSSSRNQRRSGQSSGNGTNRSPRVIRPRQQIAFDFPKPVPTSIATTVRTRFEMIASRQIALAGIQIDLNADGQLTLSGQVDSAETKRLAEMLARIEPGVRTIQNEITLTTTGTTDP